MKYAVKITFNKNGKQKVHYWGKEDRPSLHLYNSFKPITEKEEAERWAEYLKSGDYYPIYRDAEIEIIEII